MKLLITSPDALMDAKSGSNFPDIIETIQRLIDMELIEDVVTVSSREDKLKTIPDALHPTPVSAKLKRGTGLVEALLDTLEKSYSDIIVLGANDSDLFMATNSKLLLLTAAYAKVNEPGSRIFNYGISINNANSLQFVFEKFLNINEPWYYMLNVDEKTTIYALINANTIGIAQDMVNLIHEFKKCLKEGYEQYRSLFNIYCMAAVYSIKEFRDIKYWGIYPSSTKEINEDLEYFKENARKMFKCRASQPILIRTKSTTKRHLKGRDERIIDGCDEQFRSIVLNPYYQNKLSGQTVCIIDDFTTYGSSCETARILLEAAGVKQIIFATMGKFGRDYYSYDYTIDGDVFRKYTFKPSTSYRSMIGKFNPQANAEFLNSLRFLLK